MNEAKRIPSPDRDGEPDLFWVPLTAEHMAQLQAGILVQIDLQDEDGSQIVVMVRPPKVGPSA